jgi:PleD family two-component response regulator
MSSHRHAVVLAIADPETSDRFAVHLASAGIDVVMATEGLQAWWELRRTMTPCLIIVDEALPSPVRAKGFIQRVQGDPTTSLVPIVLLTDSPDPAAQAEAFGVPTALGAAQWRELLRLAQHHCDRRNQTDTPPR